jgi:hypothetical protein
VYSASSVFFVSTRPPLPFGCTRWGWRERGGVRLLLQAAAAATATTVTSPSATVPTDRPTHSYPLRHPPQPEHPFVQLRQQADCLEAGSPVLWWPLLSKAGGKVLQGAQPLQAADGHCHAHCHPLAPECRFFRLELPLGVPPLPRLSAVARAPLPAQAQAQVLALLQRQRQK